jgi:hypothetical protein
VPAGEVETSRVIFKLNNLKATGSNLAKQNAKVKTQMQAALMFTSSISADITIAEPASGGRRLLGRRLSGTATVSVTTANSGSSAVSPAQVGTQTRAQVTQKSPSMTKALSTVGTADTTAGAAVSSSKTKTQGRAVQAKAKANVSKLLATTTTTTMPVVTGTITLTLKYAAMDYNIVNNNATLKAAVIQKTAQSVAAIAGGSVHANNVTVTLKAGSVIAESVVLSNNVNMIKKALDAKSSMLQSQVVANLKTISGINATIIGGVANLTAGVVIGTAQTATTTTAVTAAATTAAATTVKATTTTVKAATTKKAGPLGGEATSAAESLQALGLPHAVAILSLLMVSRA